MEFLINDSLIANRHLVASVCMCVSLYICFHSIGQTYLSQIGAKVKNLKILFLNLLSENVLQSQGHIAQDHKGQSLMVKVQVTDRRSRSMVVEGKTPSPFCGICM